MGALVGVIVLAGLGVGAYRFYLQWEGGRLIRRAQAYMSYGDSRSAALTAQRAFQLKSSNVEACRILAVLAEQEGQPSAIEWRQQVLAIKPESTEDAIALAKTALQFKKIALAEAVLAKLGPAAEQLSTYHEVQAQLAAVKKDNVAAEKHWSEASRLAPSNKLYQLNLAALHLQASTPDVKQQARQVLQQLLDDKALRVPAARVLRDDAAERKDVSDLLDFARSLQTYPEATFRDRISYVQVLRATDHPQFPTQLAELQNEAANDPGKLSELLSWMSANRLAVLALDWTKRLPLELTTKMPIAIQVARCHVGVSDWGDLEEWCKKTKWGELEFLRHAYLSRALRERGDSLSSRSEWNTALQEAGNNGERLFALEQDVVKWGWKKEAEDLLWLLGKDPEKQTSALAALNQYYTQKGATGDLYRVVARLCEIKADDENAQNNLAQLSLLLNLNTERAHTTAKELYKKDPKNAVFASTYAFSLYRTGRYQEAAKVMNELNPDELRNPSIAAYYGIFLAAAGDKSRAAEYLERGSQAQLLPEEKSLLQTARTEVIGKQP